MPTPIIFETFGCEDAAILTPASGGATEQDIYGIQQVELGLEADQVENWGDDSLLSIWPHSQKGKLKFRTGYLDPNIVAAVTGETVTSSGSGESQVDKINFGSASLYDVSNLCFRFTLKAKSSTGASKRFKLYVYAARPAAPPTPDGLEGKSLGKFVFEFECLASSTDEILGTVDPAAMGRYEIGPVS